MSTVPGFAPTRRNTFGHNLFDSLIEWWPLSENQPGGASTLFCMGNQLGYQLTGATGQATVDGNQGTIAFPFTAGAVCLHRTTDATLAFTTSKGYTVCAWVYPTTIGAGQTYYLYAQYIGTTAASIAFGYTMIGALFYISNSSTFDVINSTLTLTANTWNFVVGYYDPANVIVGVSVNNSAPQTNAAPNAPTASTITTTIGGGSTSAFAGNTVAGRMQRVGVWKRVLSSDERTYLYNGGSGRDYPFN